MTQAAEASSLRLLEPPAYLPASPTNLLVPKRGKLMLFLMKSVKFSASRRRAGLKETTLPHHPSPAVPGHPPGPGKVCVWGGAPSCGFGVVCCNGGLSGL